MNMGIRFLGKILILILAVTLLDGGLHRLHASRVQEMLDRAREIEEQTQWDTPENRMKKRVKEIKKQIEEFKAERDAERDRNDMAAPFGRLTPVIQAGHTGNIDDLAITPDKKYLVSGGFDEVVRIWEISTGRLIKTLMGHTSFVKSLAMSRDGRHLASGGFDFTVRLWDIFTGKQEKELKNHTLAVMSVAVDPDSKHILSTGEDDKLVVYDNEKDDHGYLEGVFSYALAVSPNGKYFAFNLKNDLAIFDLNEGKRIKLLKGHKQSINDAVFSDDNQYILSGGDDGVLTLWDIAGGRAVRSFTGHEKGASAVALSSDGKWALSGDVNGTVRLWDVEKGELKWEIPAHQRVITSLVFGPDDRSFFSADRFHSDIKMWDVETGTYLRSFVGETKLNMATAIGRDHILVLVSDKIHVWSRNRARLLGMYPSESASVYQTLAISPDEKYFLANHGLKDIALYELTTGKRIGVFKEHQGIVTNFAFRPDGKRFVSTDNKGSVIEWDIAAGKPVRHLPGHTDEVVGLYCDAEEVIALSRLSPEPFKETVFQWDFEKQTGRKKVFRDLEITHTGFGMGVHSLAIGPRAEYFLIGRENGQILKYNREGNFQSKLNGHNAYVDAMDIDPEGKYAVSASYDGSTIIWDLRTNTELARLIGFGNGEWVIYTQDGYYDCSPEGSTMIHWSYSDRDSMETYSFEQYEAAFRRPDIIRQRLSGNPEAGKPAETITKPPTLELKKHMRIIRTQTNKYTIQAEVGAVGRVKNVRVFVNGRPASSIPVNEPSKRLSLEVPLDSGQNRITAIAYDESGIASNTRYLDVQSLAPNVKQPDLYVLGVGVSNYAVWPELDYAHVDALRIVEHFKEQEGRFFNKVEAKLLLNDQVDLKSFTDSLKHMSTLDKDDLAVIFLAGHGVKTPDDTYYFLFSQADMQTPEKNGLSWDLMTEYLGNIKCRVIMFLDTCHSGSITQETIVPNDLLAEQFFSREKGGILIFSASKGRQPAGESAMWGGGVFTYAILQALGAKAKEADLNRNKYVEFMELVQYTARLVDEEMHGLQTPWLSRKEMFGDFALAAAE